MNEEVNLYTNRFCYTKTLHLKVLYEGESMRPSGFKLDYKIDNDIYDITVIPNN